MPKRAPKGPKRTNNATPRKHQGKDHFHQTEDAHVSVGEPPSPLRSGRRNKSRHKGDRHDTNSSTPDPNGLHDRQKQRLSSSTKALYDRSHSLPDRQKGCDACNTTGTCNKRLARELDGLLEQVCRKVRVWADDVDVGNGSTYDPMEWQPEATREIRFQVPDCIRRYSQGFRAGVEEGFIRCHNLHNHFLLPVQPETETPAAVANDLAGTNFAYDRDPRMVTDNDVPSTDTTAVPWNQALVPSCHGPSLVQQSPPQLQEPRQLQQFPREADQIRPPQQVWQSYRGPSWSPLKGIKRRRDTHDYLGSLLSGTTLTSSFS